MKQTVPDYDRSDQRHAGMHIHQHSNGSTHICVSRLGSLARLTVQNEAAVKKQMHLSSTNAVGPQRQASDAARAACSILQAGTVGSQLSMILTSIAPSPAACVHSRRHICVQIRRCNWEQVCRKASRSKRKSYCKVSDLHTRHHF